jgi:hypothetical protein
MIIITPGNKNENKAFQIVMLCFSLSFFINLFNESRTELLSIQMPAWYLSIGNYLFFMTSFVWLCKAIWKTQQKKILLHLILMMLLWLSPYLSIHSHTILLYLILFIMHTSPLAMIYYLHKKPILPEYLQHNK